MAATSGAARAWSLLRAQWRTGRTLARIIRRDKPDVIVLNGLTTACSVLLLAPGCAPRVICCDHNHFEARSALWQTLRAWLYPKVAAVVSLTEADAARFRALNPTCSSTVRSCEHCARARCSTSRRSTACPRRP